MYDSTATAIRGAIEESMCPSAGPSMALFLTSNRRRSVKNGTENSSVGFAYSTKCPHAYRSSSPDASKASIRSGLSSPIAFTDTSSFARPICSPTCAGGGEIMEPSGLTLVGFQGSALPRNRHTSSRTHAHLEEQSHLQADTVARRRLDERKPARPAPAQRARAAGRGLGFRWARSLRGMVRGAVLTWPHACRWPAARRSPTPQLPASRPAALHTRRFVFESSFRPAPAEPWRAQEERNTCFCSHGRASAPSLLGSPPSPLSISLSLSQSLSFWIVWREGSLAQAVFAECSQLRE